AGTDGGDGTARLRAVWLFVPDLRRGDRPRRRKKAHPLCAGRQGDLTQLKELVEVGPTKAAAPLPAAASSPPATRTPADRPFVAEFRSALRLNGPGSEKETRHIILAAKDDGAIYEVGDSLGIFARNSGDLVAAIIQRLDAEPETPVLSPDGAERSLVDAL